MILLLLAAIILAGCSKEAPKVTKVDLAWVRVESGVWYFDHDGTRCYQFYGSHYSCVPHAAAIVKAEAPEINSGPMRSLDFTMIDGICSHASKPGVHWPAYKDGGDLECREIDRPKEKRK